MASNKVDMTLDQIIALDKKGRGTRGKRGSVGRGRGRGGSVGRGRGRGGSVGRGRGRGRGQRNTGRSPGGLTGRGRGRGMRRGRGRGVFQRGGSLHTIQFGQRQTAQQNRRTARDTSFDSRRNIPNTTRGSQANRRGRGQGRRTLVRPTLTSQPGRGMGRGVRGRGRGGIRGRSQALTLSTRGINRRQTGGLQQSAAASVARARRTLQAQKQFQSRSTFRGRRGGRVGRGRRRNENFTVDTVHERMQVSVLSPVQFEPEGVELAYDFGAAHHTQVSLDSRFTPAGSRGSKSMRRYILPNGRAVEYQN